MFKNEGTGLTKNLDRINGATQKYRLMIENLAHYLQLWGHRSFRPLQLPVIEAVLRGESGMVVFPTGGGKSLCYQVPAVAWAAEAQAEAGDEVGLSSLAVNAPLVVVVSPLIALMQDQVEALREKKIDAFYINSSLTQEDREQRYRWLKEGKGVMVYVTPERFRKAEFVEALKSRKIKLMAVDEAHCISQWGHDFRPDYSKLGEIRALLGEPPTLALTATATKTVREDIQKQLRLPTENLWQSSIERPNLSVNVHEVVGLDEKVRGIIGLRHHIPGTGIVYVSLISTLQKLSDELSRMKIAHGTYHGDLPAHIRKKSLRQFMNGETEMMLATPAFGLGVDKSDIRWIIHAEIPGSIEAYFQEIGRAGRDGKPSECHLFYDQDDVSIQSEFIKWGNPDAAFIRRVYHLINDNLLRASQEGVDYLRSQMNFYNKRDYRVESALQILFREGCLEKAPGRLGYKPVEEPVGPEFEENLTKSRLQGQNQKLYDLVQLLQKPREEILPLIYKYFE